MDTLTLNCPEDLLNAVPFLLGFHPKDSVVAVSLRDRGTKVGLTVRFDYPDDDFEEIARRLAMHLKDDGADKALLVIYRDAPYSKTNAFVDLIRHECQGQFIEVPDVLWVSAGHWWSLICDEDCCKYQELPNFETSPVTAAHVLAGAPLPSEDEEAFAALIDHVETERSRNIEEISKRMRDVLAKSVEEETHNRQSFVKRGANLMDLIYQNWIQEHQIVDKDEHIASLMVTMMDVHVRDYAMGMHDDDTVDTAEDFWREMVRLAPEGLVAPVATVLAAVCLERGDGAMTQRALERAVNDSPGYPMAMLLRQALEAGWGPEGIKSMRKELRPAVQAAIQELPKK